MKYFIYILGCQMNVNDAERLDSLLQRQGFKKSTERSADTIYVVACSVRQKAVDRIWGKVKKWQEAQKKIVLTGCVLPADRKKFAAKKVAYVDFHDENFFNLLPNISSETAYVTIMTGCDNFCSYCAVPYTRGREVSRPKKDIMIEAKAAVKAGYKNLMLLGQNVNSYKYGFANLLKEIDSLPGDFQFNFISSNPHDMTDEIIDTFANLKKWPRELHLAMQSGDDEVLKKMNRKYTSKQYLDLVAKLRTHIPNLKLTTDIIVGFPSETKAQFKNTVEICKKVKFDKAYLAQYSSRPGTAAAKLKDDVPAAEKKRRWLILEKLVNSSSL